MKGDFPAILKKVEQAVIDHGGSGRMGTWAYSYGYTNSVALAEFGHKMVSAGVDAKNFARNFKPQDLFDVYSNATPGAEWNGNYYTDIQTGVVKKNHVLLYQDTYIFGKGYLDMTSVEVPEKYLTFK